MNKETYGFIPGNPIMLSSIPSSLEFMRSLVSANKRHILFHRKRSILMPNSRPIDHYELLTTDNQYFDIYINVYNKKDVFIPPQGFYFDYLCSYKLKSHKINSKYFLVDEWGEMSDELLDNIRALPILERFIDESIGINSVLKNFPYDLIDLLIKDKVIMLIPKNLDLKSHIKARERNNTL